MSNLETNENRFYNSFLSYSFHPADEYRRFEQELAFEDFENSPTWYDDIEQETEFGSLEFKKIEARVNQIMDSKVGDRVNDDYRKLIFRNLSFKPELGSRYKFDNNIWIVYSTDNIKSVHSSCYVRRCNNTINIQDKYGKIHQEPCIVDIKPTKSGITEQEYMSVPIARQVLMYQLNEWTKDLFINSRIMFSRQVYKIGSIMELNRTETFNKDSIKFVKCYIDDDLVNNYDNQELQIADYKTYDYSVSTISELKAKQNETGKLIALVNLDDIPTEEQVCWYSSDESIITIDKLTGNYSTKLMGEAFIYAKMLNNEDFYSTIKVEVTEQEIDNSNEDLNGDEIGNENTPTEEPVKQVYENIIKPNKEYITLNSTEIYEVYETLNGNKTDTKFEFNVSGMSERYYEFNIINDNSFSVKNIIQNDDNLLLIECKNLRDNSIVDIEIELGGLF
jgi:hypothetical protein